MSTKNHTLYNIIAPGIVFALFQSGANSLKSTMRIRIKPQAPIIYKL
jgi:hypothetical protein